jgi:hypothetical protein
MSCNQFLLADWGVLQLSIVGLAILKIKEHSILSTLKILIDLLRIPGFLLRRPRACKKNFLR